MCLRFYQYTEAVYESAPPTLLPLINVVGPDGSSQNDVLEVCFRPCCEHRRSIVKMTETERGALVYPP